MIAIVTAAMIASDALPANAQTSPAWRLVEELRIDGNTHELTTIGPVVQSRTGNVFVTQWRDQVIRVFSSSGAPLQAIGRKGQGPGEFEGLSSIGIVGDTLFATDAQLRRITLFTLDGKVIRTITVAPPPRDTTNNRANGVEQLFLMPSQLLSNNRAYGTPSIAIRDAEALKVPVPIMAVDWTGKPVKQLASFVRTNAMMIVPTTNGGVLMRPQPFTDSPMSVFAPSGERLAIITWSARTRTIEVIDISIAGDTLARRSIPYVPLRIPSQVVDSVVGELQKALTARRATTDARQHFYLPDHFQAVSNVLMENDGTLWLQTSPKTERVRKWIVVSPRGQIVGRLEVPASVTLQRIANGVWATAVDSDDVQSVVRYRVER